MRNTFKHIGTRVLISLLSTIFVIFSSMMFFQNLSIGNTVDFGNTGGIPDDPDVGPQAVITPGPSYYSVPDETMPVEGLKLTNNQKYFEPLVSPDSTNILITVSDAVVSGWNFDTIMIMSIDKSGRSIKLLSLPRDIYIDYSDYIRDRVEEVKPALMQEYWAFKINAVPTIGRDINYKKNVGRFGITYIDFLCDILEEVFAIHIDDFAYVKVSAVSNIIDYFGDVDINVPILMNYRDPTQQLDIYLEPGFQPLDGKEAEGFLRFRQGYDANGKFMSYGDFYRKKNQTRFVQAFIEQKVTLSNLGKLTKIFEVINQNVTTSVVGLDKILSYGALAEEAVKNHYKIESIQIQFTEESDFVMIKQ